MVFDDSGPHPPPRHCPHDSDLENATANDGNLRGDKEETWSACLGVCCAGARSSASVATGSSNLEATKPDIAVLGGSGPKVGV